MKTFVIMLDVYPGFPGLRLGSLLAHRSRRRHRQESALSMDFELNKAIHYFHVLSGPSPRYFCTDIAIIASDHLPLRPVARSGSDVEAAEST
jgi:hypothetical protein